ncbi:MAG: hypothetical protein J0L73_22965 [Verrucomicrobia bacterium]|nr:hypothetical protein [Verrucomicrobiota bacterium]
MPDLPEKQARANIDDMLAAAGWAVQDLALNFTDMSHQGGQIIEKSNSFDYAL